MMNELNIYRQGEILFIKVDEEPSDAFLDTVKKAKSRKDVIREGEVTGHFHRVKGSKYKLVDSENVARYIRNDYDIVKFPAADQVLLADENVEITHDEHDILKLPKGLYAIRIQREYDDVEREKRVID